MLLKRCHVIIDGEYFQSEESSTNHRNAYAVRPQHLYRLRDYILNFPALGTPDTASTGVIRITGNVNFGEICMKYI